jgi:steroid delta-isomerase-like uncharacterized protein
MNTAADSARRLIEAYFSALNAGDWKAVLDLVREDVIHDVNEGGREIGRNAFREFLRRTDRHCREEFGDLEIMVSPSGRRAAAEFMVRGILLAPPESLQGKAGRKYELALGAFFEIEEGLIARITTYCNTAAWLARIECH